MKKIAVIVPNYNGSKYADKCLKSLENQTFRDFELCVVDDCSTDDSFEELKRYAETAPFAMKVIRSETNMGPGHARKLGIEETDSEWLAFCDMDDWFDDDFLEIMLGHAEESSSDLVMCDHRYVYGDGSTSKAGVTDWTDRLPVTKENVLAYAKMSMCRLLAKRSIFSGVTIPEIYYGEDAPVTIQLIANASGIYVDTEAHYNYLIREGAASSTIKKRAAADYSAAFDTIKKAIGKAYPKECEYIGINMILYGVTLIELKTGGSGKAVKSIVRIFEREYPKWYKNPYLKELDRKKRAFLLALRHRAVFICSAYTSLHSFLIARRSQK